MKTAEPIPRAAKGLPLLIDFYSENHNTDKQLDEVFQKNASIRRLISTDFSAGDGSIVTAERVRHEGYSQDIGPSLYGAKVRSGVIAQNTDIAALET